MFLVEASALLPFAPDAVLAAVGSVESALRWQVGVLGVRRARHASHPGALVVSYFALGERHALAARVTRYDPPHRFAYRAWCPAFTLDVALAAAPALGGTRVTYHLQLATPEPAPGDAEAERRAAALRRLIGRRAPRDLARLEAYVARRAGVRRRPAHPALDPLEPVPAVGPLAVGPLAVHALAQPASEPAASPLTPPPALGA